MRNHPNPPHRKILSRNMLRSDRQFNNSKSLFMTKSPAAAVVGRLRLTHSARTLDTGLLFSKNEGQMPHSVRYSKLRKPTFTTRIISPTIHQHSLALSKNLKTKISFTKRGSTQNGLKLRSHSYHSLSVGKHQHPLVTTNFRTRGAKITHNFTIKGSHSHYLNWPPNRKLPGTARLKIYTTATPAQSKKAQSQVSPDLIFAQAMVHFSDPDPTQKTANLDKAFVLFEQAAKAGHPGAQFHTGLCFAKRFGTVQDPVAAAQWFEKAAENGNSDAQFYLGQMYMGGLGISSNLKEGFLWLERSAQNGNASAQFATAMCLINGNGVSKKDPIAAHDWLERAANQGHLIAQLTLAQQCENGEGIAPDLEKAVHWLKAGAAQGNALAQQRLATRLILDNSAIREAEQLLQKAAAQQLPEAQFQLGLLLVVRTAANQKGNEPDDVVKQKFTQGLSRPLFWLLEMTPKSSQSDKKTEVSANTSYETGIGLLKQAAENGNALAMTNLGLVYLPTKPALAFYWFHSAANAGNPEAQFILGTLYLTLPKDSFVEQSPSKAFFWFSKCSLPAAIKNSIVCYRDGFGVSKNLPVAQALASQRLREPEFLSSNPKIELDWKVIEN